MMRRLLTILWPAFVMAGVLEVLVFAQVDPSELHGVAAAAGWSRQTIYSVAFFVFWAVIAAASALSLWLALPDPGGPADTDSA